VTTTALGALARRLRGRVRFDVPLSTCTTYRIGGPAAALVEPANAADVAAALAFARETGTRWLALGLGSNVLVADRGFDGVVLRVVKGQDGVEQGLGGARPRPVSRASTGWWASRVRWAAACS
jgi:UDP-N-acetylenolpyruvoylglucosamine reductase